MEMKLQLFSLNYVYVRRKNAAIDESDAKLCTMYLGYSFNFILNHFIINHKSAVGYV